LRLPFLKDSLRCYGYILVKAACGGFKPETIEEPIANIDEDDVNNQLAVVDYVEDIYSFYRRAEVPQKKPETRLIMEAENSNFTCLLLCI
jgi:hypothetical protein